MAMHTEEEVRRLAYQFWLERGMPIGSPEADWQKAESALGDGDLGESQLDATPDFDSLDSQHAHDDEPGSIAQVGMDVKRRSRSRIGAPNLDV